MIRNKAVLSDLNVGLSIENPNSNHALVKVMEGKTTLHHVNV
jgi:hypothetical protein